ncbi:DUF192 domain-containing protein [archaeon]|jgi:uncharacterized protein|nr:DUF192 domain-containing protein [archaeon]MBT4351434.1 DUF192 domain-containing protein [archaeon]MBT4647275.1 DUF192 domain-containing protein [archaeon]MBT6821162.1 DUF192 domain-containing protein [archaeon]MBT7391670.1 DUF192 domain-containing protein [archaeon]
MLINKTNNKKIVSKIKFCKSILSKSKGLMFSKKILDEGLVFIFKGNVKIGLHMFFVFFPIDVLFLDKDKKVVEIKQNFNPWTTYHPKIKSKYIIELPNNAIKKSKTKIGDVIEF